MLRSEYLYPPHSYVAMLMPNVMILGGGAFGRGLGHEGRSLRNKMNALIKEAQESCLVLLPCEDTARRQQSVTQKRLLMSS